MIITRDEFDPLAPQREAAMFYGLFLRGHSAETLRRDIDVPKPLLQKWLQAWYFFVSKFGVKPATGVEFVD